MTDREYTDYASVRDALLDAQDRRGFLSYEQKLALQHADKSENSLVLSQQAEIPSWDTVDVTFGFRRDNYGVELFIENLTDERGIRFIKNNGATPEYFVTRPTTAGLRFTYDY